LALLRAGFRLLTDEYAVVWHHGPRRGRFEGVLVPPMLVGKPPRTLAGLEQTLGQKWRAAKTAFPAPASLRRRAPVRLAAILALERPATRLRTHGAQRLDPPAAFSRFMSQLLDPIRSGRGDVMATLAELSERVPTFRVRAGSELASWPAFVARLAADGCPSRGSNP
jgi:hypothetical protein